MCRSQSTPDGRWKEINLLDVMVPVPHLNPGLMPAFGMHVTINVDEKVNHDNVKLQEGLERNKIRLVKSLSVNWSMVWSTDHLED